MTRSIRQDLVSPHLIPITGGPLAQRRRKNLLVETLNSVANPPRCRQPFASVRLMVCATLFDVSTCMFSPPHCREGGSPRHLRCTPISSEHPRIHTCVAVAAGSFSSFGCFVWFWFFVSFTIMYVPLFRVFIK